MRRLFLIRHAKAEPSVGRDDYERRLTDRGRADARRVAAALAACRMIPDLLIHSGAARAKETAEIFAAEWKRKVELREPGLYDASLASLLALTRALSNDHVRVGLVGHNPGLGELATALTGSGAQLGDAPPRREISDRSRRRARFFRTPLGGRRAQLRSAGALPDAGRTRGRRGLTPTVQTRWRRLNRLSGLRTRNFPCQER